MTDLADNANCVTERGCLAPSFPFGHLVAASLVLLLGIWLATGTMAPYALMSRHSPVLDKFPYLVNVDHQQWRALYQLLDGTAPEVWGKSVVLRRILHAVVSYPFWRAFGFVPGGIVANAGIHLGVLWLTAWWVRRRWGPVSAVVIAWVISTYPGITYWSGLPYAYAFIVPACLISMILLWELQEGGWRRELAASLGLGVVALGYDIIPYVLPTVVLLLVWKRRFHMLPVAVVAVVAPVAVWVAALKIIWGVGFANENSKVYADMINNYLSPPAWMEWWPFIRDTPFVMVHNFYCSNMLFLPLAFILLLSLKPLFRAGRLSRIEVALLISISSVFLFTNLSPPMEGTWKMRGFRFARLYQPLLIVFILYLARHYSYPSFRKAWEAGFTAKARLVLVGALVVFNATVVFGPVIRNPMAGYLYHQFYGAHYDWDMNQRLDVLGRRPLGF